MADSKHAPYGNKTKDEIVHQSIKNTELLLDEGCKIIVVACNTATTNAISYLREKYEVPFIGIEPAIKPAALKTRTKVVGILATRGTLSSQLFHKTTDLYASGIKVIEQVGEGIVPLIETGQLDSKKMLALLKNYIDPMIKADIDYLVLGCTHYPYLIPILEKMLPKKVTIIDSGLAVAKQTQAILKANDLLNSNMTKPLIKLYSNRDIVVLNSILNNRFDTSFLEF